MLCPGAQCAEGTILLGIILPNNTIAYADRRLKIDARQAQEMQRGAKSAERRFRFSTPCAQCGCQQWRDDGSGGKCGVIEDALSAPLLASLPKALQQCAIRRQCRWFDERGTKACGMCRYVATDCAVLVEEKPRSQEA